MECFVIIKKISKRNKSIYFEKCVVLILCLNFIFLKEYTSTKEDYVEIILRPQTKQESYWLKFFQPSKYLLWHGSGNFLIKFITELRGIQPQLDNNYKLTEVFWVATGSLSTLKIVLT